MTTEPVKITESVVKQAALAWLESIGYTIILGPEIAQGEADAEPEDEDDAE